MDTKAIVVVEDNKAIARLIQEVLNDVPGYGAVTVGNGAAALAVIAEVHADLVILDIDLPGISGFDIHDRLRSHPETAGVPVLFMSAAPYAGELASRGYHDYLRKPFDLDELLDRVAERFQHPSQHEGAGNAASPPPMNVG